MNRMQFLKLLLISILSIISSCTSYFASRITDPIEGSIMHNIALENQTIYYYTIGDKNLPPLVFLHGILSFTEAYSELIEALSEKYFVIGIDMRGHGRSSIGDMSSSYIEIVEDIMKVTNKLGYDRFYIVGHSAGGFAMLSLAKYFPEKVIKGVSIASLYNHKGIYYRDGDDYLTKNGFMDNINGRDNYILKVMDRAYEQIGEKKKFDNTKKIMMNGGNSIYPSFSDAQVREITTPILVIVAGKDNRIKPEHTKKLAELLPNSDLLIVPGAKHGGISYKKKYVKLISNNIFQFLSKNENSILY